MIALYPLFAMILAAVSTSVHAQRVVISFGCPADAYCVDVIDVAAGVRVPISERTEKNQISFRLPKGKKFLVKVNNTESLLGSKGCMWWAEVEAAKDKTIRLKCPADKNRLIDASPIFHPETFPIPQKTTIFTVFRIQDGKRDPHFRQELVVPGNRAENPKPVFCAQPGTYWLRHKGSDGDLVVEFVVTAKYHIQVTSTRKASH